MAWTQVTSSDASWPTPAIAPVLAFVASAPTTGIMQSCLSEIKDADGGIDFVPIARDNVPCFCSDSAPLIAQANLGAERVP